MTVCPKSAIDRDEELDSVRVNHDLCIGCKMCVSACPFGAMGWDSKRGQVFKCDLCDGDPQCVRFCEVKAVDFVDAGDVSIQKKRTAAQRLYAAENRSAVILSDN
jgi:Fe-S-cluster-containing hydrogenase component 2